MAFADGSTVRVALVPELTFGTTPATPSFKVVRRTGGGLRTSKLVDTADEIQPDRNVRDLMHLGQDVSGSFDFLFSYGGVQDDLIAAALYSTWTTNVIKNASTDQFFTIEETVAMGSGAESYSRFSGVMVNTLGLTIQARQPVRGTIGFMGKKELTASTAVTGATYAAASTTPISTASANVASLTLGGAFGAVKVRRLSLNITNNLRARELVGDIYSDQFGKGRFELSGEAEIYFETNAAYQAALDHTVGALSFNVGNTSGSKYTFSIPRYLFGDPQRNNGSNSSDVMVTLPFTGLLDSTENATLKITRAVT